MTIFSRQLLTISTAVCLLTGIAPVTQAAETDAPEEGRPLSLDELRSFTDVFNAIRKNHVDPIAETQLLDAALEGMVGSLDQYSTYLDPETAKRFMEATEGQYGGIGIAVETRKERLFVGEVFDGGPAQEAGILQGDLILKVNDLTVRGNPLGEAMNTLLGPPGTPVQVRVRTDNESPRDLELIRAFIPVPSVEGDLLANDVGLLTVMAFNLRTAEEAEDTLNELKAQASGDLTGLIIDLRDNTGGVIQAASLIADGFLDEGVVVYTKGRYAGSQLEYNAEPGEWLADTPVVILMNANSASASEILAGALRDHGRASLLGEKTFGKGTVQSVLQLRNGSALRLTTARYYTASGVSFDQNGIEPDLVLEEVGPPRQNPDDDEAIQAALEWLREGKAPSAQTPAET